MSRPLCLFRREKERESLKKRHYLSPRSSGQYTRVRVGAHLVVSPRESVAYSRRNPACGEGKNIALPSTLIVSFDGPSASAFNLGGHKGTHPSPSHAPALSLPLALPSALTLAFSFLDVEARVRVKYAFVRDPRHAARTRLLSVENSKKKKRKKKERRK